MNIFIKILQCLAIFLTGDLLQAQLVSNVDRVKERYQQRVAKADQIKNDAISQSTLRYDSEVKMAQDEVKQSFESLIRAAAMRNQIDEVRTLTLQMESILRPDGVVLSSQGSTGSAYSQHASSSVPKVNDNSKVITSAAPSRKGFAGDWDTSFGKMKLEVSGDSVRGTYQMGPELCQIEGTISGQEMVFNYTERSATGKGKFTLAQDGMSFSGQWLQHGSNQWKPWQGRRPSEAAGKQWNNLEELVGSELFDVNGNKVDVRSLQGKIIGLYFSAHWCRPCRDFTPKLVEFRNANAKDFEVIFVSSDRSAADQQKYMQESGMNWPSVPYQSECKAILKERFSIRGIPALIIVDGKGNLISSQGRSEVNANLTTIIAKWKNLSPNH